MIQNRFFVLTSLLFSGFFLSGSAFATLTLKQIHLNSNSQIDLIFDGKVSKSQVKTEFFNDIVQLSVTEASVYPAKISTVNSQKVSKVFAYQYAPKLVRCRFTIKGKAESFKNSLKILENGKTLSVKLVGDSSHESAENSDRLMFHAAQAIHAMPGSQGDNSPVAKGSMATTQKLDNEEKALMDKVIKGSDKAPTKSDSSAEEIDFKKKEASMPIAGIGSSKPVASASNMLIKFFCVVGLFGMLAILFKRKQQGVMKLISNFTRKSFGRDGQVIQVISTHHLGPKKSIAVVRVAERMLVIGITNDSINLISEISNTASGDVTQNASGLLNSGASELESSQLTDAFPTGIGAVAAGPAVFSEFLKEETVKPGSSSGVRARIKSRLEGLKPL